MTINANTKIAPILKHRAKALEVIISISPKFEKLRNPLLRQLMAGRTTLAMAAKLGGCQVDDFFQKLEPLGFEINRATKPLPDENKGVPDFITSLAKEHVVELDVRPVIASGKDPLTDIIERLKTVEPGYALKIINSFEPTPLILLLGKKGFAHFVNKVSSDQIETYFLKPAKTKTTEIKKEPVAAKDWEPIVQQFGENIHRLDVRGMEMPGPMVAIIEALEHLPDHTALYVYHQRIPVFLLPELAERLFDYRIKEMGEGEVHLLIFK
jgi:uncharacterized protein (DUF2249 family)